MAAAETEFRNRIKTILETEFAADGLVVYHDRITSALAAEKTVAGVSPLRSEERNTDANTLEIRVLVQVYKRFDPQIDPRQRVDPSIIEGWADRFRVACKTQNGINQPGAWYFRVNRITYPPDPTGNITRFEAECLGFGNNSAAL